MSKNEELEQVDYNSNESNAIATYSTPQLNLPQALTSSFENNDNVVRNNNNNQVQGQYNDYQNQSTGSYNTQQTTITNQSNYDNQGAYNGPRKQFKRNDAG